MLTALIVVIVVVALVVAGLVLLPDRMRSRRLRSRFGPEYERAVTNAEDQRAAERELAEREQRHSRYELKPLSAADRAEYQLRWSAIQERFVDAPAESVRDADRMVTDVMAAMGYPTEGFDQQADDLSVRYPEHVAKYRNAHQLAGGGDAGTDPLRHALLDYREVIHRMLGDGAEPAATRESEAATT